MSHRIDPISHNKYMLLKFQLTFYSITSQDSIVSSLFDFAYKYSKSPSISAPQSVVSHLTLSMTTGRREKHGGLGFLMKGPSQ